MIQKILTTPCKTLAGIFRTFVKNEIYARAKQIPERNRTMFPIDPCAVFCAQVAHLLFWGSR